MINIGIIGAGRIGQVHAKSILLGVPEARVLAIADPYMSKQMVEWAASAGIEGIYQDYHAILEDDRIDAVLVCSSTATHADISIEAIRAGKHVFCEKPVDLKPEKIIEVQAALDASAKFLCFQVGFNRRFDHNFQAIRDAVKNGRVGDVQFVRISSRDPEPPPIPYVKVSGGIFLDMMIHDIDMVRYLSGAEVEEVYASGAVLIDPAIGEAGDVDTATVSLKLSNGALALIDNSRKAVYGYDQRAEVHGAKGSALCSNDVPSTLVISDSSGIIAEKPLFFFLERYMAAYQAEVQAFVNSISTGEPACVGIDDGLMSIRIALACKKSLQENRPVRVDEI